MRVNNHSLNISEPSLNWFPAIEFIMLRPVPEFALLMAACSVIPILSKLQFQPSLHKKDGFTPGDQYYQIYPNIRPP